MLSRYTMHTPETVEGLLLELEERIQSLRKRHVLANAGEASSPLRRSHLSLIIEESDQLRQDRLGRRTHFAVHQINQPN